MRNLWALTLSAALFLGCGGDDKAAGGGNGGGGETGGGNKSTSELSEDTLQRFIATAKELKQEVKGNYLATSDKAKAIWEKHGFNASDFQDLVLKVQSGVRSVEAKMDLPGLPKLSDDAKALINKHLDDLKAVLPGG